MKEGTRAGGRGNLKMKEFENLKISLLFLITD
jgi:hypothetical protein